MLAPATRLTSLTLHTSAEWGTDCFVFTSPLVSSCLSQLKMDCDREYDAVLPTALPALPALCQLEHLDFSARLSIVLEALPLLRVGARALTHLRLMNLKLCGDNVEDPPWQQLAEAVARIPLQSLVLELKPPILEEPPGLSVLCAHELSRLTALRMKGWACMHSAADAAALARMTHLQKLHLIAIDVGFGPSRDCARAMQSLPALTSLALTCENIACFVDVLVEELEVAATQPWPELRELSVEVWNIGSALRLVTAGPKLTRLAIDQTGWSLVSEEDDGGGDDEWERLETRAAQAGVSVSIESEFPF